MKKEKLVTQKYTALLVLTAFIWGTAFVAQSVGAGFVGAYTFLAFRSWIAICFLIPVYYFSKKYFNQDPESFREANEAGITRMVKDERRNALIIGSIICGFFLFSASAVQQMGIATTTTAKAGFITAMYVVIVPVLSLFAGHRPKKSIWLCVLMSVVGLYLLCINGPFVLQRGDSLILVCAFLFALQIMSVNHFVDSVNGILLSIGQFAVTAVCSTICMFVFETPKAPGIMAAMPSILYAGVLSGGVAYTLQIICQKKINPPIASIAMCLESVFSALSGWVILGQSLSLKEILGCALMFAAILLSQIL